MRDIKFRGHHFVYEKVLPVECINFREGYISLDEGDNSLSDTFDMIDLMQYTGLKDKNGKEVYEGDIIDIGNGEKFIVTWHKYSQEFTFYKGDHYYVNTYRGATRETWVIIGNIYQNTDLLNV